MNVYLIFTEKTIAARCSGMDDKMASVITDQLFPINGGTVVTLKCKEEGHLFSGDTKITCTVGTQYQYLGNIVPSCKDIG